MSLDPAGMTFDVKAVESTGAAPVGPEDKAIEGRSPWLLGWQRLRRDRVAMISLVIIVLIVLMAIFAPLFVRPAEPASRKSAPPVGDVSRPSVKA